MARYKVNSEYLCLSMIDEFLQNNCTIVYDCLNNLGTSEYQDAILAV